MSANSVAVPVASYGARHRPVYLPAVGDWRDAWTGEVLARGDVTVAAPLDRIPLFLRDGARLPVSR